MTKNLSGCVILSGEKLLLILKKKHNHYELPGGRVKPGEGLEQAAIRETKEEIGCDVKLVKYLGYKDFYIDGHDFRSHNFLAEIEQGQEPQIKEPDLFRGMLWLPLKDYDKYPLAPNVRELCDDYKKGRLKI